MIFPAKNETRRQAAGAIAFVELGQSKMLPAKCSLRRCAVRKLIVARGILSDSLQRHQYTTGLERIGQSAIRRSRHRNRARACL
jgi:hypothetical protein